MKAVVCTRYGSPDFLHVREVRKPIPKGNEVLIKIHAATVTMGDCEIRRFHIPVLFWIILRAILGLTRPKPGIFGQEYAGEVEAIGNRVTRFKIGDTVFGPTTIRLGAHAQYLSIRESYPNLFRTEKMTYETAATITTGGVNALHFARKAKISPGEKVLINGAGGSIGTYAIQFAKAFGGVVTCVDSINKLPMLRELGADEVIDYSQRDFTKNGKKYDVIIDIVGTSPFSRCLKSLNRNGRYILGNPTLGGMLRGFFRSMIGSKKVISEFAGYDRKNFEFLRDQIEEHKLRAVIDKRFPLDQVADAHRYVEAGLKAGHVVITVDHGQ
ncbi:MAG TPA: NAD(P)-dependent alcohol dehydrogenase [Chryseolinea sp.]